MNPSVGEIIRITEVGPRDGLQNEARIVPTDVKLAFIDKLIAAGFTSIEVGAFVRSDRVPQMADTDAVLRKLLSSYSDIAFWVLVPNEYGLKKALAAGVQHIAVFTAATDAFCQANLGMTREQSMQGLAAVIALAKQNAVKVRGYVSTAWWCPFSGQVGIDATVDVARWLSDHGCDEICLADTIGAATPSEVHALLIAVTRFLSGNQLAVHFHDTRGTALANVLVALDSGISCIDAAAGGLGGCPFAPGAEGNLATEDLLHMLHGMSSCSDISFSALCHASHFIEQHIGRALPSRALRAGEFRTVDRSSLALK